MRRPIARTPNTESACNVCIAVTANGDIRNLEEMQREFTQQAITYALSHYDSEQDAAHALGLTCRGLVSMRRRYEV